MSKEKEPRKPAPERPPERKEDAERRGLPGPHKIEPPEPWPRKERGV
jgi:hypothetical protein